MLAGGLGTRLRPLTTTIPKPLVCINGAPFLDFLLQKIASMGIRDVVLLIGYKGDMIKEYCKNGEKWGLKISYSSEDSPLGTGGAILKARSLVQNTALVLNGDSYLDINLSQFLSFHKKTGALATVFAMEGSLEARGAIEADKSGKISAFLEKQKTGTGLYNTGAYLIEPSAISLLSQKFPQKDAQFSMEKDGFPLLILQGGMYEYTGKGKFLDIGTFASLAAAHKTIFGVQAQPKKAAAGAIFIDRDGVINKRRDTYVTHPDQFEFEEGALEGMRALSSLGLPIFIVTNQSIIGRGLATREMLGQIHDKMLAVFVHHNIRVTDVLFCPHSPHEGCECRKPNTGMLLHARKKYSIDLEKSFMIGDASADILMANKAGCASILVKTGYGGKDGRHSAKADYEADDLRHAAQIIGKLLGK